MSIFVSSVNNIYKLAVLHQIINVCVTRLRVFSLCSHQKYGKSDKCLLSWKGDDGVSMVIHIQEEDVGIIQGYKMSHENWGQNVTPEKPALAIPCLQYRKSMPWEKSWTM